MDDKLEDLESKAEEVGNIIADEITEKKEDLNNRMSDERASMKEDLKDVTGQVADKVIDEINESSSSNRSSKSSITSAAEITPSGNVTVSTTNATTAAPMIQSGDNTEENIE